MMVSHKIIAELKFHSIGTVLLSLWKISQVKGVLICMYLLVHSLSGTNQRYASLQPLSAPVGFMDWLLSLTRSLLTVDLNQDSIIAHFGCWLALDMHAQESPSIPCPSLTLSSTKSAHWASLCLAVCLQCPPTPNPLHYNLLSLFCVLCPSLLP